MNLYLKYRPDSFDDMVGNTAVIESLSNMVEKDCPHSILLTGPTGCGKTTLARIIAEHLECHGADFVEIDSADFRGIDTVREVRKLTRYKPIEGDTRVFIIDECHKMTNDAQNALLKILEDTPKHVYFILCTTDPQKLLKTVKGRCQTFDLQTLNERDMFKLLRRVVKAEDENLAKAVYDQIVQDSLGHPRNALQILDQVLNVDPDQRLEVAQRQAEQISQSIELCRTLIKGSSWKAVLSILGGLKNDDPESVRRHVLGYCSAVLLKKEDDRAALIIECFLDPFYNSNFAGLVFACYSATKG